VNLLVFDLDGTLIDSKLDLAHSVNAARNYMGLNPLEHELIYSYVGNGAPVLIRRALGADASDSEVSSALDFFIRYYAQHCLDHTLLYPGVAEALERMCSSGMSLAVLTNKPVRISHQIIAGLGLSSRFFRVYGGNSFDQKKPDPIGIETLLNESGLAREGAFMVGDSAVDILTARNARIRACGVTYGFQPDSFKDAPPDLLVDDLGQLADYLQI
jgi:phosphoglycolate phosphatase